MRFNISVDIQGSVFCFTLIDPDLTIFSGLLHKIRSIIEEQFSVTLVGSFIIC